MCSVLDTPPPDQVHPSPSSGQSQPTWYTSGPASQALGTSIGGAPKSDPKIKRVVSALIDGTVSDGGSSVFRELYFALMEGASWHVPDHYYLLGDLESYVEAKLKANSDYANSRLDFARKCWANMCFSGKFSSDRTISDYAKEIWKIEPVQL